MKSTSTYSFRSQYKTFSKSAGQTQLLAPAVIISTADVKQKTGFMAKLKRFAGSKVCRHSKDSFSSSDGLSQSRKHSLPRSASQLELSFDNPILSLSRSCNTLSDYPLRSSFDSPRPHTLSPPRRSPHRPVTSFGAVPLSKSTSSQSVTHRDLQDFASSLFSDHFSSSTSTPMNREWTQSTSPRSRSSSISFNTPAASTSSARSSFSTGPITPGDSVLPNFWSGNIDGGNLKQSQRPVSPRIVQPSLFKVVPLDGVWGLPEDDSLLKEEFKRILGMDGTGF